MNTLYGMPILIEIEELEDTAKLCKDLQLDFIELNMNFPQNSLEALKDTSFFKKIAKTYDVFYTLHLDENLNVCDFNPIVRNAYLETVKQTIVYAKEIGVKILNMHMNRGIHMTLPSEKVYMFDVNKTEYLNHMASFKMMCEEAIGESNLKIAIENTNGYTSFQKEALAILLESDYFVLTWDIGHSNAFAKEDEPYIKEHLEHLVHFHFHDSLGSQDHMTLGSGEVDLNEKLAIIKETQSTCLVETKTVEALKDSVDWLEKGGFKPKRMTLNEKPYKKAI